MDRVGARRARTRKRARLESSRWIAVLIEPLKPRVSGPGAHVLAVVLAHRGYVAEVSGRCSAPNKFSERAAKTAADESERGPRWLSIQGIRPREMGSPKRHPRLSAVAAKGYCNEARPRVAS